MSTSVNDAIQASIIIPHANFASMARDEDSFFQFLSKHMGQDAAAKLMQQFDAASYSKFQIWEYNADLSMDNGD